MPEIEDPPVPRNSDPSGGANQARVRAYNERLVLSLVRWHVEISKAEIARRSRLSAQTVTVIIRELERDGLLLRGDLVRGKVGQPSTPMRLDPDGAFALGLVIGRRSAELVLMDFKGGIRQHRRHAYPFPSPDRVGRFVRDNAEAMIGTLTPAQRDRVAGLGIATPFELWNWEDHLGVTPGAMAAWRDLDLGEMLATMTGLPVVLQNDGTAACSAELLFGRGRSLANYAYFHIGYFVGGGVVLDNTVISGPTGNAGALGTVRVVGDDGAAVPLLDVASLHLLEDAMARSGYDPSALWQRPHDWNGLSETTEQWIGASARHLATAILSVCSVVDFEAVVIDGNIPDPVRKALCDAVLAALDGLDPSGISPFSLNEGTLGPMAQVMGAASLPIISRYQIDSNVLFRAQVG